MRTNLVIGGVFLAVFVVACSHPSKFRRIYRSLASTTVDSSGYAYDPADTSCGGFPQLTVGTAEGTCLGLVLPKDKATGVKFPRTLQQIPGTQNFLLVDMGGWANYKGGLFLMSRQGTGPYSVTKIKDKLHQPHGFLLSADGFYYLGERHQISRFR